jgi:hypothetical protein
MKPAADCHILSDYSFLPVLAILLNNAATEIAAAVKIGHQITRLPSR